MRNNANLVDPGNRRDSPELLRDNKAVVPSLQFEETEIPMDIHV